MKSLNETSSLLPDGVYTTFRTYQKKYVLYLTEHFERLIHSAQLTGHALQLDTDRIRLELRKALAQFSAEETRVRISIDLTKDIGNIYLILEELHIPALQEYRCGVAVITRKMHRENPQAKVTSFISRADQVRREEGMAAINETLMVSDQGQILEGLSSNFFGIRNRVIYTAGEGVLPGITRKLVIEVAEEAGFPVELRGITTDELGQLSEAFITSASRAILPVTKINNRPVGTGQVGKITQTLQIAFQKNLDAALEEI
ncbi:aminotransferase class IV [Longilinea arvoryzae]|uniref:aminotransferase class IV n=1 Tax=Longilinea arvoryzae TaxID=360412 RepID=UPI001F2C8902|nr:aminotransferase class IV [Longilinea arvoryzae]